MQRERSRQPGGHQQPRQTTYEIAHCDDCGHEYVRPIGRVNILPCGKCTGRDWTVSPLMAGTSRPVGATC